MHPHKVRDAPKTPRERELLLSVQGTRCCTNEKARTWHVTHPCQGVVLDSSTDHETASEQQLKRPACSELQHFGVRLDQY